MASHPDLDIGTRITVTNKPLSTKKLRETSSIKFAMRVTILSEQDSSAEDKLRPEPPIRVYSGLPDSDL